MRRLRARGRRVRPGAVAHRTHRKSKRWERARLAGWADLGSLAAGDRHSAGHAQRERHLRGGVRVDADRVVHAVADESSDTVAHPTRDAEQVSLAIREHEHLEHANRLRRRVHPRTDRTADR